MVEQVAKIPSNEKEIAAKVREMASALKTNNVATVYTIPFAAGTSQYKKAYAAIKPKIDEIVKRLAKQGIKVNVVIGDYDLSNGSTPIKLVKIVPGLKVGAAVDEAQVRMDEAKKTGATKQFQLEDMEAFAALKKKIEEKDPHNYGTSGNYVLEQVGVANDGKPLAVLYYLPKLAEQLMIKASNAGVGGVLSNEIVTMETIGAINTLFRSPRILSDYGLFLVLPVEYNITLPNGLPFHRFNIQAYSVAKLLETVNSAGKVEIPMNSQAEAMLQGLRDQLLLTSMLKGKYDIAVDTARHMLVITKVGGQGTVTANPALDQAVTTLESQATSSGKGYVAMNSAKLDESVQANLQALVDSINKTSKGKYYAFISEQLGIGKTVYVCDVDAIGTIVNKGEFIIARNVHAGDQNAFENPLRIIQAKLRANDIYTLVLGWDTPAPYDGQYYAKIGLIKAKVSK